MREVVAADHHRASVDARDPDHRVRRREGAQLALLVPLGLAGQLALLLEAVRVDQRRDPLPHREAPARVLLSTASAPPCWRASSRRRSISSTSGFQLMRRL